MGFFNNVKARFGGNGERERQYEDEFERAFREGSWPEGVEGFEPLANTGAFLPQEYDVDPLADASLPGNAMRSAGGAAQPGYAPYDEYEQYGGYEGDEEYDVSASVVRGSGAGEYVQPAATVPLESCAPTERLRPGGRNPYAGAPTLPMGGRSSRQVGEGCNDQATTVQPVTEDDVDPFVQSRSARPARSSEVPEPDDGVHVFSRADARTPRPAPTPQAAPRPFADRLRERVAAAASSVVRPGGGEDLRGRQAGFGDRRSAAPAMDAEYEPYESDDARRPRRGADAEPSVAYDDRVPRDFDERRERPRARAISWPVELNEEPARAPRADRDLSYGRPEREEARLDRAPRARDEAAYAPEAADERRAPARGSRSQAASAAPKPVPVSCIVLRPRNYDVVSEIAQGVISEKRPTVLVLRGCNNELIRRVLDFSFGLCCASGAGMREFGDRVYAILPKNTTLTDEDMVAMRRQGILKG